MVDSIKYPTCVIDDQPISEGCQSEGFTNFVYHPNCFIKVKYGFELQRKACEPLGFGDELCWWLWAIGHARQQYIKSREKGEK